jgi:hypothetical protein
MDFKNYDAKITNKHVLRHKYVWKKFKILYTGGFECKSRLYKDVKLYNDEKLFIENLYNKFKTEVTKSGIFIMHNYVNYKDETLFSAAYMVFNNKIYKCHYTRDFCYIPPILCAIKNMYIINHDGLCGMLFPINYKLLKPSIIKKLTIRGESLRIKHKWLDADSQPYKYEYKSEIKYTNYDLSILDNYLIVPIIDIINDYIADTYTFCFEEHPNKYDDKLINNYLYVSRSKRKNTFFVNKNSYITENDKKYIINNLFNF